YRYQVTYTSEPGITIPGVWRTSKKKAKDLVVFLHDEGHAVAIEDIDRRASEGKDVLAIDLRGFGETAPGKVGKKPAYFGVDSKEAFLALHLNRPLLGQRVYDVLTLIEGLARESDAAKGVTIHAVGNAGLVALHAAALDPRINTVTVERT